MKAQWLALVLAVALGVPVGVRAQVLPRDTTRVKISGPVIPLQEPVASSTVVRAQLPASEDVARDTMPQSYSALPVENPVRAKAKAKAKRSERPTETEASVPAPRSRLEPREVLESPEPLQPLRPSTRIAWQDADTKPVRLSDYEQARDSGEASGANANRNPAARDGLAYLTDGRYSFRDSNRPSGRSIWLDEDDVDANADRTSFQSGDFVPTPRTSIGDDRIGSRLGNRVKEFIDGGRSWFTGERKLFESDHAFDGFVSPVTNPFFFEDPRSLTELRPIVVYQQIPGNESLFRGGSVWFFGGQARLAITDRFSIVMNKLGIQTFRPSSSSGFESNSGLSELWVGPKYVFYRNAEFQTLMTAGATFQIPLGGESVFQDTGRLSVVPYLSVGQRLLQTEFGTFNGLASGGYSFSINKERSNFFYASAHIDLDVLNNQRWFPLAELNWFSYTTNGKTSGVGPEGRDLFNFGTAAKGTNLVTWALGTRFKSQNKRWEVGGAFESPLIGQRELFKYRFTLDFIWRF